MKKMMLVQRGFFLGMMLMSGITFGQSSNVRYSCQTGEVAFGGYDLVSYFNEGARLGNEQFKTTYQGIVLYFSSKRNRDLFIKTPEKYMPAYGGWCATGIVHNNLIVPNFSMYKIQNDQLLFFEVRGFFNGLSQWQKDTLKHEFLADRHYRQALSKHSKATD